MPLLLSYAQGDNNCMHIEEVRGVTFARASASRWSAARFMLAARPGRSSSILTRRFCAGARHEWQSLSSGLRIKHVRLSARGGDLAATEGCCPCATQVSDGNQGDEPVGDNQTIRVTYTARLEDDTELISNRVASFKVGTSSQVLPAPPRRRTPPTPPPSSCCRMSSCLWRALLRSARRLMRECGGCMLETAGARLRCRRKAPPPAAVMHRLLAQPPRLPRRSAGSYAHRSI